MMLHALVWCIIGVQINIGQGLTHRETAAKGVVTKLDGDYIYVDFSKYAREMRYVGDYYNLRLSVDECTPAKDKE